MHSDTLLKGWKEIGKHLGVSPATARRYKKKHGLPVRYLPSGKPCLYVEDIRIWLKSISG